MENYLTIFSFLAFTGLVFVISYLKTKSDKHISIEAYFLGGRSLGCTVIAGSLLLTNLSTEQMIGLNGSAYLEGLLVMAWETLASLTMVILAIFFLPRYLKSGLTTIPQFLEDRFDSSTRTITNILFLLGYILVLLPIILYSGAIGLSGIFEIPERLNISQQSSLILCVFLIGTIGAGYAIFGGLRAVAISDTLNGLGLLVGGLIIPYCGLKLIGNGNVLEGFASLQRLHPEKFNAIGSVNSTVPFSTIFTGMLLVNLFYWCTNQVIVQRVLAARNLREGQKGVIIAAALKLLAPLIVVLPGIIAFHLFGDELGQQDLAFPMLVKKVLPRPLIGFFAAVLFGAILSSFNSTLNSASTLFSIGIDRKILRPNVSEQQLVSSGKMFCTLLAVVAMLIAPLISYAPAGLFGYLQEVNGCYTIPILTVILAGLFHKKMPPIAAKFGLVFGSCLYFIFSFWLKLDLHFLHVMFITFVLNLSIIWVISWLAPQKNAWTHRYTKQVNIEPWDLVWPAGLAVSAAAVSMYLYFSQLRHISATPLAAYAVYLIAYLQSDKRLRAQPSSPNLDGKKLKSVAQEVEAAEC